MQERTVQEQAWIGDAVLALWARQWILDQPEIGVEKRSDVFIAMTSNRFLGGFADPTSMEARIGVIYEREGMEAAFDWMHANLLPVFEKQLRNRSKGRKGSKLRR
jgi:dsRNA-specific ribonuclease